MFLKLYALADGFMQAGKGIYLHNGEEKKKVCMDDAHFTESMLRKNSVIRD